ncbi:phospholipid carrier-dependent glycosyltransferase [Croceicoccus ponticola]|uniref:Polyprenol-phosphate-mannose--protein mannosyltransferase n=1 Tax=Croceicoccus ponticola TaxID=2217664 RepID=A0A437GZS8_9SPHN|nr:phospholipid carrier-dependent glycosyltransferase [Croceicoccus ponticola]RVQ68844.1 phospholipid carrier-dependent glycosyltransferase [Croceicoccus ponticola]
MPMRSAKSDLGALPEKASRPVTVARDSGQSDPLAWMALIVLAFAALALFGIDAVAIPIFDEVHYLPAARLWIDGTGLLNPEHPVLGKQLIAVSMIVFGDNPFGWRAGSALFACLTLLAMMRMTWLATRSRFAALTAGVLAATNFLLLVQARIAMLDTAMLALLMLGCWSLVAAVATRRHVRLRTMLAGVLFGMSFAVKWNAAPVIAFAGLCIFAGNLRARYGNGRRPLGSMSIFETFGWLALLPLAVYFASFQTIALLADPPARFTGPIEWQRYMLELQESVIKTHGYMSNWWDWVIDRRPIWYFYEEYEGVWRGMLFLGNPLQMWSGLAALIACGWLGLAKGRMDCLAVTGAWIASLAMWIVAPKPVQFYYHYLICAQFIAIALALALDAAVWRRPFRRIGRGWAIAFLIANGLLFAYFYPILTTMPLPSKISFADYAWLESWR